jgi:hypothetical protein
MDRKIFTDTANILGRTQTAIPDKITSKQAQLLKKAAGMLADAEIVSRAAEAARKVPSWQEYWDRVRAARITLERIADGGKPETTDIIESARLCASIALV